MATGGLAKLRITYDQHNGVRGGPIEAMFNPTEIGYARSVNWKAKPVITSVGGAGWYDSEQQFLSVSPASMSIELFFDTYERATDVRLLTDEVAALSEADTELHHPPVCHLSWGSFADIFTGVVTAIDQRYTMFLPDGTPVRATVTLTLVEFVTRAHAARREPHSSDVDKRRTVRQSDTLQSLAAEEYGDPQLWRHIARENGIVDPRALSPGRVLRLPKLAE